LTRNSFTQGIAFERLATLLFDLLDLDISEGALVNMLDAARASFTAATAAIRASHAGCKADRKTPPTPMRPP
jgi:hypothetical protein